MKINNTKKLLDKIEGRRSNLSNGKDNPKPWARIHFKTYPRLDKVNFGNINAPTTMLSKIFRKRRSIREFSNLSISKKELYSLLFLSSGITHLDGDLDNSKRTYPSAGARYPLEVYPIVLNCEGVEKGLYHYNVKENSLEMLLNKDLGKWLAKNTGGEKWIMNVAVVFVITAVLDRARIKYGDRGYRLALIETGHLGQNMLLLATELGLGSCPIAGFVDSEINKLLDINLQKEVAIYMIAVGKL